MDTTPVLCAIDGPVALVTLNEPHRRNPMSPAIIEALIDTMRALRDDDQVRVVILNGAGAGFCAGADLSRMRSATPLEDRDEYDRILVLNEILWDYPKPTIAAVHGFALGAGANLMSWCDIVVADEHAKLGYPEVKAGVPSATVIPNLLRLVGRRRMMELTMLGTTILAPEAEHIGLINRVAPAGTALDVARELAAEMGKNDPFAMRQTKEIIRVTSGMNYREAMTYAKEVRVIVRLRKDFEVHISQGGKPAAPEAKG